MEKTFDERVKEYRESGLTLRESIWKVIDEDWIKLFSSVSKPQKTIKQESKEEGI
jgi:hypothetical protein